MCLNCYREYGAPTIWGPRIQAAVALIGAVFDESLVGGKLHVVVDDWNLEESHVQWSLDNADTRAETACAHALMAMTLDERASALGAYDEFWKPETMQ